MTDTDRMLESLRRRVEALEDEAAQTPHVASPHRSSPAWHRGNRRQVLLGGAGLLGTLAGGALLGHAEAASAATISSPDGRDGAALHTLPKHVYMRASVAPLKTRGVLWVDHEWDFGALFVGKQPPVVVATALDNYMQQDVAAFCVCAATVHGEPGAYRATIMVRNISRLATEVEISAVAFGA